MPVFTLPSVIAVALLMAFPVAYTLYMSVHSWYASSLTSPQFIGLGNFRRAFLEDDRFRNALWLTVYFTALATALQLVLGVSLALVLNRPFRGKGLQVPTFGGLYRLAGKDADPKPSPEAVADLEKKLAEWKAAK